MQYPNDFPASGSITIHFGDSISKMKDQSELLERRILI